LYEPDALDTVLHLRLAVSVSRRPVPLLILDKTNAGWHVCAYERGGKTDGGGGECRDARRA